MHDVYYFKYNINCILYDNSNTLLQYELTFTLARTSQLAKTNLWNQYNISPNDLLPVVLT